MKDIQHMNRHELYNRFRSYTYRLNHLGWWSLPGVTKRRNDALECLHRLMQLEIKKEWYKELIYGTNLAIGSYKNCTGYAKQWKQLLRQLNEENTKIRGKDENRIYR